LLDRRQERFARGVKKIQKSVIVEVNDGEVNAGRSIGLQVGSEFAAVHTAVAEAAHGGKDYEKFC
jgi:hypothetical protein